MKKKVCRPRPEHPAGVPVEVEMLSVPKDGSCTVRFLSEARSILTHRVGEDTKACPGVDRCPSAHHRAKTLWKAYAAVERWRDRPYEDWVPEVIEITERLWERLCDHELRGEVWTFRREVGRAGHKECVGELVDRVNPDRLRTDVILERTVYRVYRTDDIKWDVEVFLQPRQILEASKDGPPRGIERPKKDAPKGNARALNEILKEGTKRIFAMPTESNGNGNGNH